MKNKEKLNLILEDLEKWLDLGESDCSMSYAFRNGYVTHAASLWIDSGALSDSVYEKVFKENGGVSISRKDELKEINEICENAYIYICPDCNHYGFYDDYEGEKIPCISCNKKALLRGDNASKKS